NEKIERTLAQ
ncbi:autotransporter beta-domain protein, partial [Chlamydia psittaci 84-8471/1]